MYFTKEERLSTFENWPIEHIIPKEKLAENGFIYLGRGDEVRCIYCKVEIMRWEIDDNPEVNHRRWAPQCPLNKNVGKDVCGTGDVSQIYPAHLQFATYLSRLKTFHDWPVALNQKPEKMASAGFFYTGEGDKTKCFFCDGGLKDWEKDDIPWEEHAQSFPNCQFVKDNFNIHVNNNLTNNKNFKMCQDNLPNNNEFKMCQICDDSEISHAIQPCGHVGACVKCIMKKNTCPFCRQKISNIFKLYFV